MGLFNGVKMVRFAPNGADEGCQFITLTTNRRLPLFASREIARVAMELILYASRQDDLVLMGFVIMPDHIHILCRPVRSVRELVRALKKNIARMAVGHLEAGGKDAPPFRRSTSRRARMSAEELWQKDFQAERVTGQAGLVERLKNMYEEPVKKRLCENVLDYEFSDIHRYLGLPLFESHLRTAYSLHRTP